MKINKYIYAIIGAFAAVVSVFSSPVGLATTAFAVSVIPTQAKADERAAAAKIAAAIKRGVAKSSKKYKLAGGIRG